MHSYPHKFYCTPRNVLCTRTHTNSIAPLEMYYALVPTQILLHPSKCIMHSYPHKFYCTPLSPSLSLPLFSPLHHKNTYIVCALCTHNVVLKCLECGLVSSYYSHITCVHTVKHTHVHTSYSRILGVHCTMYILLVSSSASTGLTHASSLSTYTSLWL